MKFAAETIPETSRTRQILETNEIKIVRGIAGKTLPYREISEDIRKVCKIDNINAWVLKRKIELGRLYQSNESISESKNSSE